METRTTTRMINTEHGSFCVQVEWEPRSRSSATPDHGDERWTEWEPTDVEVTDDDGEVCAWWIPYEEEAKGGLEQIVMDMLDDGRITADD